MLRLLLVRHPGTAVTRTAVVPAVAPLPDLTGWLGCSGSLVTSPARRCRVAGASVDARLGPWDLGRWTGQPLSELDLMSWRSDPAFAGHGGESLLALSDRVRDLLADWQSRTGRLVAVTHAPLIKVAVVQALHAPVQAVWDLDVTPGSTSELHTTPSGWRVTALSCPPPAPPA